jgi:hypothetical protein
MQKTIALTLLLCFAQLCFAQTSVQNLDFEAWTLSSSGRFEDPSPSTTWATPNYAMDLIFGNISSSIVQKSSDAHGGSFSALMKSRNIVGNFVGATLFTGKLDASIPFSPVPLLGIPFTGRPLAVSGWRKYSPIGGDSSSMYVRLTKWNSNTNTRETIAFKEIRDYAAISTWTKFNLVLDYTSTDAPDSITIVFSASAGAEQNQGEVGSSLWVDDVTIDYPQAIENTATTKLLLSPNPCTSYLVLNTLQQASTYTIYNCNGQIVQSGTINAMLNKVSTQDLMPGTYTLQIRSQDGKAQSFASFVKW